jgi:NADH-quinone oxidoreductase subunit L
MMAMGVGARDSAMLQLFTHAFFKAGLFLAAGSVIHALHQAQQGTTHHFNVQDIRNLGGLKKSLPLTFLIFIICGASLAGVPFFSGFQSKDSIISAVIGWAGNSISWKWILIIACFSIIFLTISYTFRLIWFVFIKPSKSLDEKNLTIIESPFVMRFPMVVLGLGSFWWIVSVNPFTSNGWWIKEELSHTITIVSGIWVVMSLIIVYLILKNRVATYKETNFSRALDQTLYLDKVFNSAVTKPLTKLSAVTTLIDRRVIDNILHATAYVNVAAAFFVSWFDRNIIDGTVSGVAYFSRGVGRLARSTQGGIIQYYIFWSGLGIIALLLYLIL